jgi:phosphonopyruvate decarboxylase
MIRYECLEWLAPRVTDQLVVTSLSGQRIEWAHLSRHEGNLLVGMMGCALGVGVGLALALPHRRVVVLESDGSVLLSLFNLVTLGALRPANLAVFVFDNGAYSGSRISQPTATAGAADLEAMARGAGIARAVTVRDLEGFRAAALPALGGPEPAFVVCKVEESLRHREIPRPTVDLAENKYRFARYLERTEGRPLPFLGRG